MSNNTPRKPLKSTQSVPYVGKHERAERDSGSNAKPQMLVIVDSAEARATLFDHFCASGWDVHVGATTQETIDLVIDRQPEVIIVDLFMPNINAQHLVRTLRGAIEHDVRIIGLATSSPVMFERARQAAVEIVLPKPVDLAAIDAFLAAKKSR